MGHEQKLITLTIEETEDAVDVLRGAFRDYALMRHVIEPDTPDYEAALHALVDLFVRARVSRGDPILAVRSGDETMAVASLTLPSSGALDPDWIALREMVWADLGEAARARYEACGVAWSAFDREDPEYHVNMIGVREGYQGRGLGRSLLDEVHRRSLKDPQSTGVSLTTENPANVRLYEYFGYTVVGHQRIAEGLETWGFFRED